MEERPRKQAACSLCRRDKTKCERQPSQSRCRRCTLAGCECIRKEHQPGRQKGTKNKRVGLEKALFQVRQAVERSKFGDDQSPEDKKVMEQLHDLLEGPERRQELPTRAAPTTTVNNVVNELRDATIQPAGPTGDPEAIESAESPLQLLSSTQPRLDHRSETATEAFFSPTKANLDVGDDIDPISLGLATEEEAKSLFSFFHANLSHTRWGLEPKVYTMAFTRSRSAFLLTSVMAASALFMPLNGALSRRLANHAKHLARNVIQNRHRSVEVVLAFLVNIPWMFPGKQSSDDETCLFLSMATTIAVDLSLHKILVSRDVVTSDLRSTLGRGECLDSRAALAMDGFSDVDTVSTRGRLLLRSRERCWISLFVVEKGMCLARGRPSTVPLTSLIKHCDAWHTSDIADTQDEHLLSMAVLRRDLDGLLNDLRTLCDGAQVFHADGSLVAQSIQAKIEHFFDQWYSKWASSLMDVANHQLPPYIEILVTHTRLSIYGGLINHPTASNEVRQSFRTGGLSSALNVMRAAIQGEARLSSMPNNTAVMISFAACFALRLSAYVSNNATLIPSIKELVGQTADVLERIGSITSHRNGPSIFYAAQLRAILAAGQSNADGSTSGWAAEVPPFAVQPQTVYGETSATWPDTMQFSTMSDAEIAEILNAPENEFEPTFEGLSWDDLNSFDWLNWPESI